MEADPDTTPRFVDPADIAALLPTPEPDPRVVSVDLDAVDFTEVNIARTGTVYGLYDPREPDRIRYVGQTVQALETRLSGHLSAPAPRVRAWLKQMHREACAGKCTTGCTPLIKPLREDVPEGELNRTENEEIAWNKLAGADLLNSVISPEVDRIATSRILQDAQITPDDLSHLRAHPSRYVLLLRLRGLMNRHLRRRRRR
ncbi:hypothetical protein [Streptomyces sp. NPDC053427]|uniref:hypothetical protein n=1 Tax=Streptomyces sp. NPDC053427 TaxID=3365701 RepID=UPI0037CFC480